MPSILIFLVVNALLAIALAGLIWIACQLFRSAWFANRAWLLVLLKLVTPSLILLPVLWNAPEENEIPMTSEESPFVLLERNDLPALPEEIVSTPHEMGSDASFPSVEENPPPLPPSLFDYSTLLVLLLLGGSLIWWGSVWIRIRRFHRWIAATGGTSSIPNESLLLARDIQSRLGLKQLPEIRFVEAKISPMLDALGWFPRVLLPRELWNALDPEQQRTVLAHELAHYRRGDHWVRWLELIVLGLYWWLPLAWLVRQQLRRSEEVCCDETVLSSLPGHQAKYAEALIETAAFVSHPQVVPLASSGATTVRQLKGRLQMIFQNRTSPRSRRWSMVLALLIGAVALPIGFVLGQDAPPKVKEFKVPLKDVPDPNIVIEKKTKDGLKPIVPTGSSNEGQKKTTSGFTQVSGNYRSTDEQNLRDELELLEAQLVTKQAGVVAAERNLKIVTALHENTIQAKKQGTLSQSAFLMSAKEFTTAQSDLELRSAELKEHMVRVEQAKRRVKTVENASAARMMPSGGGTDGKPKTVETSSEIKSLQDSLVNAQAGMLKIDQIINELKIMDAQLKAKQDSLTRELESLTLKVKEVQNLRVLKQLEINKLTSELNQVMELQKSKNAN